MIVYWKVEGMIRRVEATTFTVEVLIEDPIERSISGALLFIQVMIVGFKEKSR